MAKRGPSIWECTFTKLGVFWRHDGNPKRPYVRLTSGKISDLYFNGGKLISEHPATLREACKDLMWPWGPGGFKRYGFTRVIGPAKGAISFAYELAVQSGIAYAYADAIKRPGLGTVFEYDGRFRTHFHDDERFVFCEDTITTGGSVLELIEMTRREFPNISFEGLEVPPTIMALCNRSGLAEIGGFRIKALIEIRGRTWEEGENPYTGGPELVPPVSAGKANWHLLTQAYD